VHRVRRLHHGRRPNPLRDGARGRPSRGVRPDAPALPDAGQRDHRGDRGRDPDGPADGLPAVGLDLRPAVQQLLLLGHRGHAGHHPRVHHAVHRGIVFFWRTRDSRKWNPVWHVVLPVVGPVVFAAAWYRSVHPTPPGILKWTPFVAIAWPLIGAVA